MRARNSVLLCVALTAAGASAQTLKMPVQVDQGGAASSNGPRPRSGRAGWQSRQPPSRSSLRTLQPSGLWPGCAMCLRGASERRRPRRCPFVPDCAGGKTVYLVTTESSDVRGVASSVRPSVPSGPPPSPLVARWLGAARARSRPERPPLPGCRGQAAANRAAVPTRRRGQGGPSWRVIDR